MGDEVNRKIVAETLGAFTGGVGIVTEDQPIVVDALHRFAGTKVDFADALLAAYAAARRQSPASFDRDLDRFGDIQRLEP
ncbi:MAG: hypothetical protein ACYC26_08900 [Phycisphaerales bacterium]